MSRRARANPDPSRIEGRSMSAQEIDYPTAPAQSEPATQPQPTPPAAEPAAPKPRRRTFLSRTSVRLSGLLTGLIAGAGLAIALLSQPAPKPAPATETAAPAAPAIKPPSISVVEAVEGPITQSVVVTGDLVPREEVLVAAQIDGNAIDSILVEEGDRVEKGQVLARLSRSMIDAGLAQSAAQIARADAAIAQAK